VINGNREQLAGPFLLPATFRIAPTKTMKRTLDKKKIARNVANALAAVPIDNKQERDAIRAKLRRKYTDLKPLKLDMNAKDRRRFEELGELIDRLEACETRPTETRL
jgi:hypothetical protein